MSVCRPYVGHGVCLFVVLLFGMGFVSVSVCHPYVWHGVCLFVCFVVLMFADGWVICNKQS